MSPHLASSGPRPLVGAAAVVAVAALGAPGVRAQDVRLQDLVFSLGASVERYSGNLSAVTVPVIDSTDRATAAVGELAVSGIVSLLERDSRSVVLSFDGGMRQSAAMGFVLRDYAPREWVGSSVLRLNQRLGTWASFWLRTRVRTRSVKDRPPMPLFLQPGYTAVQGLAGLVTRSFDGVSFDVQLDVESANYRALEFIPQLDLLDRRGRGLEIGARWGADESPGIRFFGGLRWTDYEHQGSFDPDDPFRRDRTIHVGLDWDHRGNVILGAGLEGTINRSNSNRPEYDAVSFSALFSAPLPKEFTLNASVVLTAKSYVHETAFARLVPGEEADNASIAYVQLARPVAQNLDGTVRVGWTRAETDIGSSYYRRFGLSVGFNYRPRG